MTTLYVLTIIFGGQFYQEEAPDPVTCFVVRAHAISSGATYAKCEVIRYVAA